LDEEVHGNPENSIPQETTSSESVRENIQDTIPTVTVHSRTKKHDNQNQPELEKDGYDQQSSNGSDLELQRNNMSIHSSKGLASQRHSPHNQKDEIDAFRQANDFSQNGQRQNGNVTLRKSKEDSSDSEGEELIPLATVPPLTNNQEDIEPKIKKHKKKQKTETRELPPLRPLPTLGQYSESPC